MNITIAVSEMSFKRENDDNCIVYRQGFLRATQKNLPDVSVNILFYNMKIEFLLE